MAAQDKKDQKEMSNTQKSSSGGFKNFLFGGFRKHKPENESTGKLKDENIESFNGENLFENEWNPKDHILFPSSFQKRILYFVLFLKRNQISSGLKIPKFVLFEIIKKTI